MELIQRKSLESFKEDYPISKQLFLYRGKERLKIKNVLCLPCEDFLKGLDPQVQLSQILEL